jgi:hypothetical protein
MQKFIRILGLVIFVLSLNACVKEDIPTFREKIIQHWLLEDVTSYYYEDADGALDTLLQMEMTDTTLWNIGVNDSISIFQGSLLLQNEALVFDTAEFYYGAFIKKSDKAIEVNNEVYEVFYLEFGEMILKQYINNPDLPQYDFEQKVYTFKPFVADPSILTN